MERGGEEWLRGRFPHVMMDVKIVGEPDLDIVNPLTNNSLIKVSRLYSPTNPYYLYCFTGFLPRPSQSQLPAPRTLLVGTL